MCEFYISGLLFQDVDCCFLREKDFISKERQCAAEDGRQIAKNRRMGRKRRRFLFYVCDQSV